MTTYTHPGRFVGWLTVRPEPSDRAPDTPSRLLGPCPWRGKRCDEAGRARARGRADAALTFSLFGLDTLDARSWRCAHGTQVPSQATGVVTTVTAPPAAPPPLPPLPLDDGCGQKTQRMLGHGIGCGERRYAHDGRVAYAPRSSRLRSKASPEDISARAAPKDREHSRGAAVRPTQSIPSTRSLHQAVVANRWVVRTSRVLDVPTRTAAVTRPAIMLDRACAARTSTAGRQKLPAVGSGSNIRDIREDQPGWATRRGTRCACAALLDFHLSIPPYDGLPLPLFTCCIPPTSLNQVVQRTVHSNFGGHEVSVAYRSTATGGRLPPVCASPDKGEGVGRGQPCRVHCPSLHWEGTHVTVSRIDGVPQRLCSTLDHRWVTALNTLTTLTTSVAGGVLAQGWRACSRHACDGPVMTAAAFPRAARAGRAPQW
jgi:hypothetical protein